MSVVSLMIDECNYIINKASSFIRGEIRAVISGQLNIFSERVFFIR